MVNVAGVWPSFYKYLVDSLQSVRSRKVHGLISVSYRHIHTSKVQLSLHCMLQPGVNLILQGSVIIFRSVIKKVSV